MKTITVLIAIIFITISGCSNFISPSDPEQSRASKPTPADTNSKPENQDYDLKINPSKAAPSTPSEEIK